MVKSVAIKQHNVLLTNIKLVLKPIPSYMAVKCHGHCYSVSSLCKHYTLNVFYYPHYYKGKQFNQRYGWLISPSILLFI